MTGFNLIDRPWIPVTKDGTRAEVSLREGLINAANIDGLTLDDPLETVAILRQVLIPAMLHALGAPRTPREWQARWDVGHLDGDRIAAYLAEYTDRFDLFHPTQPFAQVAGLHTAKNEAKPISVIIPRIAAGNNVPLFSARTEADPPALTPAEAARALLGVHCWDTAAIKSGAVGDPRTAAGKTTGNPTGSVGQLGVLVPVGATLFQTLLLNTPVMLNGLQPTDRPQWSAAPAGPAWCERGALGLLDLLTWQSRRVRLVADLPDEPAGSEVVRRVVVCAGDRLPSVPHDMEPHTAWRRNEKPTAGSPPSRPIRHQPGKSAWRGLGPLLATASPTDAGESAPAFLSQLADLRDSGCVSDDLRLQVLAVGVRYGNQSAVIEEVMVDDIPLPLVALTQDSDVRAAILEITEQAEQLRRAGNQLGDGVRAASGAEKIPWDKGLRLGEVMIHGLGPIVRRILAGLHQHPDDFEAAERAWRIAARRIAWEVAEPALAAAPRGAFLGRQPDARFGPRVAVAEASFRRALNEQLGPADAKAA